jgi:hypothetical protein
MRSKLNRLLCFLVLALPAAAQLDSAQLRVKFGAPLDRETFRIPPGFDLVVDYGAGNQVCTLQVPAVVEDANVQNVDDMKQKMYAFLAELVPDATRGKEINRSASVFGAPGNGVSISSVDYEHVRIIEVNYANQPFRSENTITVQFKSPACQGPH